MSEAIERFGLVLKFAGEHRVSDVLFKAGSKPYFKRVAQLISRPQGTAFSQEDLAQVAQHLMSAEQMGRFNSGAEVRLVHPVVGAGRFRIHIFRQRASIGLAVRAHPGRLRSARDLGLPAPWLQLCARQSGLLLVCSGAGHGRSTSLAALTGALNDGAPPRRIVTVGDCIEIGLSDSAGWTAQRAIGVDAPTWEAAVRGAMQQGADVIALDDPHGAEAWRSAVDAAERGVLVLATVAARDVATGVGKVLAELPVADEPRFRRRLAPVLAGATEQRMVPSADGSRSVVAFGHYLTEARGFGLIRDGHDVSALYDIMHSRAGGMMTADQGLAGLVGSGATKAEIALANAVRPQALQR